MRPLHSQHRLSTELFFFNKIIIFFIYYIKFHFYILICYRLLRTPHNFIDVLFSDYGELNEMKEKKQQVRTTINLCMSERHTWLVGRSLPWFVIVAGWCCCSSRACVSIKLHEIVGSKVVVAEPPSHMFILH